MWGTIRDILRWWILSHCDWLVKMYRSQSLLIRLKSKEWKLRSLPLIFPEKSARLASPLLIGLPTIYLESMTQPLTVCNSLLSKTKTQMIISQNGWQEECPLPNHTLTPTVAAPKTYPDPLSWLTSIFLPSHLSLRNSITTPRDSTTKTDPIRDRA